MSAHPLPPDGLPAYWREIATFLRAFRREDPVAGALERAADELERALEGTANELLSLRRAAAESGYTVDHIGRILRHQPTLNKGRKHAPRIRRGDLPKKRTASGTGLASAAAETHFDDRLFRSIAYSKFGG